MFIMLLRFIVNIFYYIKSVIINFEDYIEKSNIDFSTLSVNLFVCYITAIAIIISISNKKIYGIKYSDLLEIKKTNF